MIQKYERIDPYPNIIYTVESMDIGSITQVDDNVTKKEDMPMKNASQLDYNIIDEYKDFLQNNGTCVTWCVIDNLLECMVKNLELQENILNVW